VFLGRKILITALWVRREIKNMNESRVVKITTTDT
jgi:hypothetical protein